MIVQALVETAWPLARRRKCERDHPIARCLATLLLAAVSAVAVAQPNVLPPPAEPFTGKIGVTYADSTPAFPTPVKAPAGAPNVVLIMTDDVGFGAASTFGGPIPTPNLDQLAEQGLSYNRFHTTAMCSPTRAALLTGRNHHAVGNGIVANLSTGFPGYDNLLPKSAATIAEVLRQNGYNTAMFGKHHNAPEWQVSAAGPFDLWPTGLGFEYFFGFIAAETNQYTPALYRGITPLPTLKEGVLDKALANDAIDWLHQHNAAAPDKPFFMYYATGTAHAPLQAPADWIAKFRGRFDAGYDQVRADTVARQKKLGIIPADAVNTPRPEQIAAWKDLTPAQRRINARMMEVYAAMLAYQDAQVGRLLDEIERMRLRDNTLVIFIEGDNGASAEAGAHGSMNPMSNFANGTQEDEKVLLANLDKLGGPDAVPNFGYGWTWATNAPFRLAKQYASHLGGTRNGMVVSWPQRIKARGIRSQFSHVTDIAPTIFELAGITAPEMVNGVKQQPIDGVSLAYSFDLPAAPERHRTQYFEMMGNRAIYHDGWMASTTPAYLPWIASRKAVLPSDYAWELYDLRTDFSQAHDLASTQPQKLAQMQALFMEEARHNQVLPLDNRLTMERFLAAASQQRNARSYTYWGAGVSVPAVSAAPILNHSFTVTANIEVPEEAHGVIMALGSKFGGWSFFINDGTPVALMAASQLDGDQSRVAASAKLPEGKSVLRYRFVSDGGSNAGGEMQISADDKEIGRGRILRTISKLPEMTDTMDIGFDADTPVSAEYHDGGRFNGTVKRVDITIDR
ncbi:MAG: arylsulfatase [Gammaproteobacteria bacterium]|nr:arylsulfatase [Gammaproteobacteria bacterium]